MQLKRLCGLAALAAPLVAAQNSTNGTSPGLRNWGVVLFPAFQALDVFGPLDVLNILSISEPMNLYLISNTTDPVSTQPRMRGVGSNFSESVLPTHTFDNAPNLDVLIVPGGIGTRAPVDWLQSHVDFISNRIDSVQYLFTVCTGAGLAARSGVLDGRCATGNKAAWEWVTTQGPNVNWITHARWVEDGNIWSTSGVSAGIDGMFAFIADKYGEQRATDLALGLEYTRHMNASYDPFAEAHGLPPSTPCPHSH